MNDVTVRALRIIDTIASYDDYMNEDEFRTEFTSILDNQVAQGWTTADEAEAAKQAEKEHDLVYAHFVTRAGKTMRAGA